MSEHYRGALRRLEGAGGRGAGAVVDVHRQRWCALPSVGHCRREAGRIRGLQGARLGSQSDRVDTCHRRARTHLAFAARGSMEEVPVEQMSSSLVLLTVFVAGAVFALFNPQQGLQDRMTRTSLVAR